ncbi:LysM peptidoglycan-binding domain-containing protein [Methylobacterium sp.]|uniref:LysM peptidoglycan-binding domain-containing protein n=1 Tax=Methylobacterium sp. TaxID=409 RepID=UPI00257B004B|nr:LysM peptidoglycan-binding domain-containing protein [Methylobacterium sp.]
MRGDNLWTISRRTYGEGERYTLIFDANQDQVRDPDLIYPGQVLVLPDKDVVDAGQTGKRD